MGRTAHLGVRPASFAHAAIPDPEPALGERLPGTDELREAAESRGITVHVLREDDDLTAVARESGADVLGMAGGDGSLAAVAAVAIERDVPFVCIPFGTRNHFARDLGLDRDDPIAALAAFDGERAARRRRTRGRPRLPQQRLARRSTHDSSTAASATGAGARCSRGCARCSLLARDRAPLGHSRRRRAASRRASSSSRTTPTSSSSSRSASASASTRACSTCTSPTAGCRGTWDERTRDALHDRRAARPRSQAAIDGEPEALETPLEFRIEPQRATRARCRQR